MDESSVHCIFYYYLLLFPIVIIWYSCSLWFDDIIYHGYDINIAVPTLHCLLTPPTQAGSIVRKTVVTLLVVQRIFTYVMNKIISEAVATIQPWLQSNTVMNLRTSPHLRNSSDCCLYKFYCSDFFFREFLTLEDFSKNSRNSKFFLRLLCFALNTSSDCMF